MYKSCWVILMLQLSTIYSSTENYFQMHSYCFVGKPEGSAKAFSLKNWPVLKSPKDSFYPWRAIWFWARDMESWKWSQWRIPKRHRVAAKTRRYEAFPRVWYLAYQPTTLCKIRGVINLQIPSFTLMAYQWANPLKGSWSTIFVNISWMKL